MNRVVTVCGDGFYGIMNTKCCAGSDRPGFGVEFFSMSNFQILKRSRSSLRSCGALLAALALIAGSRAIVPEATAQPEVVGQWTSPQQWIYPCIHASLLPTGKVIFWPGYTGDTPQFWDPVTTAVTTAPHAGYNIFCSGHVFDAQGKLQVVGGQLVLLYGLKDNATFNAFNNTWNRLPQLNYARWYPAITLLPSGDILCTSGLDETSTAVPIPEVFEQATGRWRPLRNASLTLPFFPRMFVAPNGKVFCATLVSRYLDATGDGTWTTITQRKIAGRDDYGSAVQYAPGKVMYVG
jgi:hypothetical protein